jgi:hypothetical protein
MSLRKIRRHSPAPALALCVLLAAPGSARAHNGSVHRRMTDYAYEVLLAGALFSTGQLPPGTSPVAAILDSLAGDPDVASFYAAMAVARPKLKALPSGLDDLGLPCADDQVVPDWDLPTGVTLADTPMSLIVHPVQSDYGDSADCGLDKGWTPSGLLGTVNLPKPDANGGGEHRDHTGLTLGHWSTRPDRTLHDWRMRSTTLETLQEPVVQAAVAGGVTVAVSALCALACSLLPFLCAICPALAVGAAGGVIDEINSVDASDFEHKEFAGLGHHVDVKPAVFGLFDDRRGKYAHGSGPAGSPDEFETVIMALFDLLGFHVNRTTSQAPTNYEILAGGDAHPDSVPRTQADWETPIAIDLQFTPVDNLAKWGFEQFKAGSAEGTRRFGWTLHGIGDGSVPMHALGTTGHGHRPYEESVDAKFDEFVGSENTSVSASTIQTVVLRGVQWRKAILQWRAQHGMPKDIPVRDLVTQIAAQTRAKGASVPGLYNSASSLDYQFLSSALALAAYDNPAITAYQRDTVLDAIALKLAVLVSLGEVL